MSEKIVQLNDDDNSGAAVRVVILLVLFAQLSAFLGDLFTKLLLVHLCRLGYLFFLELLFICRCPNIKSYWGLPCGDSIVHHRGREPLIYTLF